MRVFNVGKRKLAVGLDWDEYTHLGREQFADQFGEGEKGSYVRLPAPKGAPFVVGFGDVDEKFPAGTVALAGALCQLGKDGIYVGKLSENEFWYVLIAGGRVAENGDRILPGDEVLDAVAMLRDNYGIAVYAEEGLIPGALEFRLDELLGKASLAKLRTYDPNMVKYLALSGVMILVAAGWYGYSVYSEMKQQRLIEEAEIAARESYMQQAAQSIIDVPVDGTWVDEAFRQAQGYFIPMEGGYRLTEVNCRISECLGTYEQIATSLAKVPGLFTERYGKSLVRVEGDAVKLSVQLPLVLEVRKHGMESIMNPKKVAGDSHDLLGAAALYFSDFVVFEKPAAANLPQTMGGPEGMPVVYREQFAIGGSTRLDGLRVRATANFFGQAGFVATNLKYAVPESGLGGEWRVDFARLHGGVL